MPFACSRKFVEQRFCVSHIGGVEALGEPVVNGCQQLACFGPPPLLSPQAGEARRGPQFERLSLLPLRHHKGFSIRLLRGGSVADRTDSVQFAAQAQELRPPPPIAHLLGCDEGLGLLEIARTVARSWRRWRTAAVNHKECRTLGT